MAAQFGRRLRRGATTTAVAAVAIAALSASQAPGVTPSSAPGGGGGGHAAEASPPPGTPVTGNSPYYTDIPPLNTPVGPDTSTSLPTTEQPESGIPASVLAAYKQAETSIAGTNPGCNLPWQLLAAIGKVESGQARGGDVDAAGTTKAKILGPVLNGSGFANISDTDNGEYDGDAVHDRAVGPMQFIPQTWETWGQDANGDGRKDPNNIYDAALATGLYLCAGNRDLSIEKDLHKAILGYNHSQEYLTTVLSWLEYYRNGTYEVPDGSGVLPSTSTPSSPPTNSVEPGGRGTGSPSGPPSSSPTHPGGSPSGTPSPGDSGHATAPPSTPPTKPPATTPPAKPPTTPPPTQTPSPVPKPVVRQLVKVSAGTLTATAGSTFGERPTVRAADVAGRPVAGIAVQFEISGTTDSLFSGGSPTATVTTGKDGLATAPALKAGAQTGDFTVRATVSVRTVAGVGFAATVTARQADVLAVTGAKELTAAPGAEFAGSAAVKATSQGAAVAGTSVSASIAPADSAVTGGPYFKDAAGSPVRSLKGLTTDADGNLQLPKIFADDAKGSFVLSLVAAGGAAVTIQLTVA
jgi:hypothetical protein